MRSAHPHGAQKATGAPPKVTPLPRKPELVGHHDVDELTSTTLCKRHCASLKGEQGVVLTAANVGAWVEVGTALANDDLACVDLLTTETLHTLSLIHI